MATIEVTLRCNVFWTPEGKPWDFDWTVTKDIVWPFSWSPREGDHVTLNPDGDDFVVACHLSCNPHTTIATVEFEASNMGAIIRLVDDCGWSVHNAKEGAFHRDRVAWEQDPQMAIFQKLAEQYA